MSKRWTLKDDEFLVRHAGAIAGADWLDYLASHDLGHHGKGAGKKRMAKLIETGVLAKIEAAHAAQEAMNDAWFEAFGHPSLKAERAEMREFSEFVAAEVAAREAVQ